MDVLEKVLLFDGIKREDLGALLGCLSGKKEVFEKNEIVFMMGDSLDKIGIVLSGTVQIVKEDYDGNRNIIANVGAAGIFGEALAFSNSQRSPVTVESIEKSEILLISPEKIVSPCRSACEFHSRLIFNMISILASKNVLLNQKIEILSKKTTREKILSFLYSKGLDERGKEIAIDFNRQELADYLSVNRSALSAELSSMREDGILDFNKNIFSLI